MEDLNSVGNIFIRNCELPPENLRQWRDLISNKYAPNMKKMLLKKVLRSALSSVGLESLEIPQIFFSSIYQPPEKGVSAIHIVIEPRSITVHEHSTERMGSFYRLDYGSLDSFIRKYVGQKIDASCTIYVATIRKDALERLKSGDHQEFFSARNEFENALNARLEAYLNSWRFMLSRYLFEI